MVNYFGSVLARWPDLTAFAREVNCPVKTAREWFRFDSIPAPWFLAICRAATARGFDEITAEHLADLAERRRKGLRPSASTTAEHHPT